MTHRTVLHLDIDAFFASVERLLDPSLAGRPVIVGGLPEDRGVVASCSYDARARGVHAGMPLQRARRLCPDAAFLRGNHRNYRIVRDRIREILLCYSPTVEFTSIDDAYMELTGLEEVHGPPLETAARIRTAVLEKTGLSVSMGIGTSKLMARIASACAKPAGILLLMAGYERTFLSEMEVDHLPGVGRKTAHTLEKLNIHTIGDLALLPAGLLESVFGLKGREIAERARGIDRRGVKEREIPLSVSRETTFPGETACRREVESMLHYLVERAAAHLREKGLAAAAVEVKVRYADFRKVSRRRRLPRGATDQERILFPEALAILDRLLVRRVRVRLVGVTLLALKPRREGCQRALPLPVLRDPLAEENLSAGIDRIRRKFGFGALTAGRSIEMLGRVRRDAHGFILRTPSLTR